MSCIHEELLKIELPWKWKIKEIIQKHINWINTSLHHRKCDIQRRRDIKINQQKVAGRVTQGHLHRKYKVLSLTASMMNIVCFFF
jgi:hypothetical protein